MCTPVSPATLVSSSAPSTMTPGSCSTSGRAWVKVGTPLAAAIDAARELAGLIHRAGETPVIVMLTDGRANIARDGAPGRARAHDDALAAAAATVFDALYASPAPSTGTGA